MLGALGTLALLVTLFAVSAGAAAAYGAVVDDPEQDPGETVVDDGDTARARSTTRLMRRTMGLVLLALALLKLVDLRGFARAFARYDLIARATGGWYARAYPFLEGGVGAALLAAAAGGPAMAAACVALLLLMGELLVSVGVALWSGRNLHCACFGAGLRIPLSSVSVAEGVVMCAMGAYLLAKTA